MTSLDRFIQAQRIRKVKPLIPSGCRVLDIGAADATLYNVFPEIGEYVGIEPTAKTTLLGRTGRLIAGLFPEALDDDRMFDVITMLAVLEHIPRDAQQAMAKACARYLKPGGSLIVTVPSPSVDRILDVLLKLRLIHGMALEEHYGFAPEQTPSIFNQTWFELVRNSTFQLGLNNLFVFRRK